MNKEEYVKIFNAMIRGTPVSFDKLTNAILEYLTEINCENSDKIISLIVTKPKLVRIAWPKIIEHFRRKYNIIRLDFNSQILMYYE